MKDMPKAMIACYLPKATAESIEVKGYEEDYDLHLTLVYLGDISLDLDFESLTEALDEWAESRPPLFGQCGNVERFEANENTEGKDVAYIPFASGELTDFRESLLTAIAPFGLTHASEFEYTPHITVAYIEPGSELPSLEYQNIQVAFNSICLCVEDLKAEFVLLGASAKVEEDDIIEDAVEQSPSGRIYVGNSTAKFNKIAPTSGKRKMYWGTPTPDDLNRINAITGQSWEPTDWEIVPFMISNNLLWRDKGKWHLNVLSQMPQEMVSRPILFDHSWHRAEEAIAVIIDAFIESSVIPPGDFIRDSVSNQRIVQQERYRAVYAIGAFHADMAPTIRGLRTRRINDVSTGANIWNFRFICPDCSKEHGFEVDVRSVDDKGRWICPHLPPDFPADGELPVMEYIIYDGMYDGVELSLCVVGNLPAAGAVR